MTLAAVVCRGLHVAQQVREWGRGLSWARRSLAISGVVTKLARVSTWRVVGRARVDVETEDHAGR